MKLIAELFDLSKRWRCARGLVHVYSRSMWGMTKFTACERVMEATCYTTEELTYTEDSVTCLACMACT